MTRLLVNGKRPQAGLEGRLAAAYELHRLADVADRAAWRTWHSRCCSMWRAASAPWTASCAGVTGVASGTEATRAAMADLVVENLHCYFTTGRLVTPVPCSPA
jgi:hypothetical protein